MICDQEIVPPSSTYERRGMTSVEAQRIAALRGLQPQELTRRLQGDLDAIVMAAMRREPHERYATAALLAKTSSTISKAN